MSFRTRFAPSPTGPLHLGHAYSALLAFDHSQHAGGHFLLRIEDIDRSRCRAAWETQIYEDLRWLGIRWDQDVLKQSENTRAYTKALDTLWRRGLVYPCFCNRRDIQEAARAPQEGGPTLGPDGIVYPGTCRDRPRDSRAAMPTGVALRLDMRRAARVLPPFIAFENFNEATQHPQEKKKSVSEFNETIGDFVVSRLDMGTSYHLSVVVDDAAQAITHVIRGEDLCEATFIHVVLQHLLGLAVPQYLHHRLIRDDAGKRLAKRDDARAISKYRDDGATPQDIRTMVGLMR